MTSVERVLAYVSLPTEAPRFSHNPPPATWPSRGEIVLRDVSMKYHEDGPLVLRNINLTIEDKEKVGIVGRTGAGKSSFVTLLCRLAVESGEIRIDGIDIAQIGSYELKQKISILPQEPILFNGSLRNNLNMFETTSDAQIWDALREVNLHEVVEKLPGQLYSKVSESGSNFSLAERQLLCLARTILRHNKILIVDEVSANMDYRTDALIQETVRKRFADCTVLTVAHRLQTIMDSDRIMVLEDGEIIEFDKPAFLLQKDNGYFKRLTGQFDMTSEFMSNE